jgi:plastocyanin
MRRPLVATAVALLALAAAPASAQMGHDMADMGGDVAGTVSIQIAAYNPPQTDVLVGDTLRWSNDSVRPHTVTAVSGAWTSAQIGSMGTFSHRFDTAGVEAYYCTLHPYMRGEVDVHNVLLSAPKEPGAPNRAYALHGRAALPAGSTVAIQADTGAGFQPAATATVDASGAFTVEVTPSSTTTYRAAIPGEESPAVQLLILDRKLAASARTRGRKVTVSATVTPVSPGATVVLQLRIKQHFGWWPVARAKVDRNSRARFVLPLGHRYPARVALTLADGATQLALSPTLRVGPR